MQPTAEEKQIQHQHLILSEAQLRAPGVRSFQDKKKSSFFWTKTVEAIQTFNFIYFAFYFCFVRKICPELTYDNPPLFAEEDWPWANIYAHLPPLYMGCCHNMAWQAVRRWVPGIRTCEPQAASNHGPPQHGLTSSASVSARDPNLRTSGRREPQAAAAEHAYLTACATGPTQTFNFKLLTWLVRMWCSKHNTF